MNKIYEKKKLTKIYLQIEYLFLYLNTERQEQCEKKNEMILHLFIFCIFFSFEYYSCHIFWKNICTKKKKTKQNIHSLNSNATTIFHFLLMCKEPIEWKWEKLKNHNNKIKRRRNNKQWAWTIELKGIFLCLFMITWHCIAWNERK